MSDPEATLVRQREFSREPLKGPGHVTRLGASRVQYLCFDGPHGLTGDPVLLVGGAFQTFWSFRHDVERLTRRWPVILVDLPGQGLNLHPSEGMGFSDFAALVRDFLDHHGIERVTPVGLSYGSGIAHRIAVRFPERVHRLILGGTAPRLQPSLRAILHAARWIDEQGEHEAWAWSCVLHLINLEAREQTGVEDRLLERFHESLMGLPMDAHDRWWTNSSRLFSEELSGTPRCPALVFGCKHDHFMPPFQAAEVARGCADVQFGVLAGGDHLANVERPQRVLELYERFLRHRPLDDLPWFQYGDEGFAACRDRRVRARGDVQGIDMWIEDPAGERFRVAVRDLGHHGAGVAWPRDREVVTVPAPLHLELDGGATTRAVVCPGSEGDRLRFLFTDPHERARWIASVERALGSTP